MRGKSFRAVVSAFAVALLGAGFVAVPEAAAQDDAENQVYDPALFQGLEYRMVGPYRGGRSTAVTGHPSHPHTFYMGSTGGGVWKTEDAGQSWINISDGYFDVGAVGAVTVAPSDPGVIYVGTGSACVRGNISIGKGMYRSVDGGKTWDFIGLPEAGQIGDIQVHPKDPDLVYVAALGNPFGPNEQRGVFRSKDGGETWEKVLFISDSTGIVDLSMNPKNPREIYAAAWRAERKPWTMISGAAEGGIYKTTDGGETWEKLGGGLPEDIVGKAAVSVSPADPDRVWAIVEAEPGGGVYRSDDAGKTWTRVNSENKLRQRAWYYMHINADPQDPNTVYALNTGLYRSVDGGKTFERISVPHGDVHDLWINPEQPELLGVANDGGAQVSITHGESWSSMFTQPTAEMYDVFVDNQIPYRLYSGQQDNSAISVPAWSPSGSIHPKTAWEFAAGCETGPVAFHPDHPETLYGGCYGGSITRMDVETYVGRNVNLYPQLQLGQKASDLRHRFQWVSPIVVDPHDPNTVYHASQYVNRSTDGGMTWETISPDLTTSTPEHLGFAGEPLNHDVTGVEIYNTIFSLVVSPHDRNTLWVGTDDGRVHITRDGGRNWTDITPDDMPEYGTVDEIHVSAHDPATAYMAVQKYRMDDFRPYVFKTENYGEDWELLTDGENGIPADYPVRTVREDSEVPGLLFAGTEFGLFVSFDDGEHWQSLQQNLPVTPVTGMKVHRGDLVISTQGRSFWIMDDIAPLRQLTREIARAKAHLFEPSTAYRLNSSGRRRGDLWPEGRARGAFIDYYLAEAPEEPVTLQILDAAGNVVRTFTSDSAKARKMDTRPIPATAGMHRFTWDLRYPGPDRPDGVVLWGWTAGPTAPPGEYTARLVANGVEQTRTFRVAGDPRLDVARADYEAQFELAVEIRDTLDSVWGALRSIRAAKGQIKTVSQRVEEGGFDASLIEQADELLAKLSEVEKEITQVKSKSGQDPIRFPGKLDNQIATVYGYVIGAEGPPTAGAYERFRDLNEEWAPIRTRVETLIERDLTAFNAALRDAGVPAIILPQPDRAEVAAQ